MLKNYCPQVIEFQEIGAGQSGYVSMLSWKKDKVNRQRAIVNFTLTFYVYCFPIPH